MANAGSPGHQARDDGPLVFVHVPKTAGTTFTQVLEQRFWPDAIYPGYFHSDLARAQPDDLAGFRLIRGHFYRAALMHLLPPSARYLTMLREPVARTLSQYTQLQTHIPDLPDAFGPGADLEQYFFHPEGALQAANVQTRFLGEPLVEPPSASLQERLAAETKRVMAGKWVSADAAQQALHEMSFFGLVERFDDSMALLSYTLGWRPIARVEPLNIAPRRLTREQVPEHVLARVAELNCEDSALYAYAERLFEERYDRMVRALLNEHYRRTAAASTPRLSRLQMRFDGPQASDWIDSMWYPAETDASGRVWRWTGPGCASTIDLPLAVGCHLVVRFGVPHAVSPEVLASLELEVNRQPIPLRAHPGEAGETTFEGIIPRHALAESPSLAALTFRVARTIAPRDIDPGNLDERLLGVALSWLQVAPAEEDKPPSTSVGAE